MEILIVNYKGGNATSVLNAVEKIGLQAKIVSTKKEIHPGSIIILPGVGSAKATLNSLTQQDINNHIYQLVKNNESAYLGICIGMQILFSHSEEENTDCWNIVPGKIHKFSNRNAPVPLMGWMPVRIMKETPEIVKKEIVSREYFYFVNSYYAMPKNNSGICGKTTYEKDFCSLYVNNNIAATQFHVEKSGVSGLRLLKILLNYLQQSLNNNTGDNKFKDYQGKGFRRFSK